MACAGSWPPSRCLRAGKARVNRLAWPVPGNGCRFSYSGMLMGELLTAVQMRAIEEAAIASGEVTGLELMERAGRGVVKAVYEEWPELAKTSHRAVVLCGPGNNGGDGFVVARLLKELGWEVEVFMHGDPAKLPPDAKVNYERWDGLIRDMTPHSLLEISERALREGQEVLPIFDGIFGIGQRAPLDDLLQPVNDFIDLVFGSDTATAGPVFVAIDIPTGYDADTGEQLARRPIPSDMIVTFHRRKPIHTMPHMLDAICTVVDIGL